MLFILIEPLARAWRRASPCAGQSGGEAADTSRTLRRPRDGVCCAEPPLERASAERPGRSPVPVERPLKGRAVSGVTCTDRHTGQRPSLLFLAVTFLS